MPRMAVPVVLSIIAIVMSAASLLWQVVSWRRSGPVVTVTVAQSLAAFPTGAEWFTSVTARNTGRAPITVTGWGFQTPDGGSVVQLRPVAWASPVPYRLEPGSEGSWLMATDDVQGTSAERGVRYQDLRAFVRLADGRTVTARRRGIGLA
ncbi:hypothetical protein [Plantactinospora sp. CA-290183]|uniref:hypothetical protein n=1 Tax=Plantactinospora sp. CA-290183 TaxID=3240006 RepID=UPI003D92EC73